MAFAEFWEEYPPATNDQGQRVSRSNRARTRDLFFKLVKSGIKPEELIQAARNYAYEKRDDLRYVMGAQRFLGRERWFEQFMGESGPAEEPVAETGPLDPFNPEERARLEAKMSGGHDQEADES